MRTPNGGCSFAPGAAGNIATEDVVFMFHEMGIETGIYLQALLECVNIVKPHTSRELAGHFHKSPVAESIFMPNNEVFL